MRLFLFFLAYKTCFTRSLTIARERSLFNDRPDVSSGKGCRDGAARELEKLRDSNFVMNCTPSENALRRATSWLCGLDTVAGWNYCEAAVSLRRKRGSRIFAAIMRAAHIDPLR
jgi:hypothetical protein